MQDIDNQMPENNSRFLIFQTENGGISVDMRFEGETVWLTQAHLAELFQTSRPNITMHIKNIWASGELEENVFSKIFLHITEHGAIEGKMQTKYKPIEQEYLNNIKMLSDKGRNKKI
jgi:hypothetical protein